MTWNGLAHERQNVTRPGSYDDPIKRRPSH